MRINISVIQLRIVTRSHPKHCTLYEAAGWIITSRVCLKKTNDFKQNKKENVKQGRKKIIKKTKILNKINKYTIHGGWCPDN